MLVPYKKWLLAKQRRRLSGSWDRDMRSHSGGFDDLDMFDVVQSPQFKARFAEIIGMGTNPAQATAPIRGRAVPCIDVDDTKGHTPKGED